MRASRSLRGQAPALVSSEQEQLEIGEPPLLWPKVLLINALAIGPMPILV